MQQGFVFDLNKCVACQACVVACQIENSTLDSLLSQKAEETQIAWRSVTANNQFQYPDLPVFSFSMACNHCEDAPCMLNCPALAFTRETVFGAVMHHADACIGCQYCVWVCPYDAPKYNPFIGIIEKCTLCVNRLQENRKPACACSCPTGALDFSSIFLKPQLVKGFVETGIKPSIELKELRNPKSPKQEMMHFESNEKEIYTKLNLSTKQKYSILPEWPLLTFTLFVPVLVSGFYASFSKGFVLNPMVFIGFAILAMFLSLFHLGKIFRAWRAVLNVRNSWLSREIVAYSLFVPASAFWLFLPQQNELGLVATIFGLLTLVSIDNLYRQIPSKAKNKYHSADVLFFTVFLYVAILVSNPWMFSAAILIKTYLYITRKMEFTKQGQDVRKTISGLRILIGFVVPVILVFIPFFQYGVEVVFIFVFIGEFIDRSEFYLELQSKGIE
jgi:Fe-S-cluster-containing dehydrogenase component/DMSO reductase anchor subunit